MGTNFYWIIPTAQTLAVRLPTGQELEIEVERDDPRIHIGKRSAAGLFCWDCNLTLCRGGIGHLHKGRGEWYEQCPQCNGEPVNEGLSAGPAALELGFAQPRASRPTGVRGCSSFSWAQDAAAVRGICEQRLEDELIEDEYGRRLTGNQFLGMLAANVPVEFYDSVGAWFS